MADRGGCAPTPLLGSWRGVRGGDSAPGCGGGVRGGAPARLGRADAAPTPITVRDGPTHLPVRPKTFGRRCLARLAGSPSEPSPSSVYVHRPASCGSGRWITGSPPPSLTPSWFAPRHARAGWRTDRCPNAGVLTARHADPALLLCLRGETGFDTHTVSASCQYPVRPFGYPAVDDGRPPASARLGGPFGP